jgi:hypothetical protein
MLARVLLHELFKLDSQPEIKGFNVTPKCTLCERGAMSGKKYCHRCGSMSEEERQVVRQAKKFAEEKAKAKKWARSEASTISLKGVKKNRWRSTYDGPRVLHESYLMNEEQATEEDQVEGSEG